MTALLYISALIVSVSGLDYPVENACSWSAQALEGLKCRPNTVLLCELWRRIYSRHAAVIDDFTAVYYNERFCVDECLDQDTFHGCGSLIEGKGTAEEPYSDKCVWMGSAGTDVGGSCRGNANTIKEEIENKGASSKAHRFSYFINTLDCQDMCMATGLSISPDICPTLRDCCILGFGREPDSPLKPSVSKCTYDSRILARKYAPSLIQLSEYDMLCRENFTPNSCLALSANTITLPDP